MSGGLKMKKAAVPRRSGVMELLRESVGCQFVIPVYQRNYTWNAEKEIKQFLSDLKKVLSREYRNHFMGIIIYLDNPIDFKTRELSVIDGQQRLTTIFLTIYAIKEIFEKQGSDDDAKQLEDIYLTNSISSSKIKYKLKPLVSDDEVYQKIVDNKISEIENTGSNVYKNYVYIRSKLEDLVNNGVKLESVIDALDELYVVCVPIADEDNAQKIFESINATGVKLTAADLIRNYLLMNLQSDIQEEYYKDYWKKIEDYVSSDSKILEMFFRMYLAVKKYELVPKTNVYRNFVEWVEEEKTDNKKLLEDLVKYAKIYNFIQIKSLDDIKKEISATKEKKAPRLLDALTDFRKIKSDLPLCLFMEVANIREQGKIGYETLGEIIYSVNAYLLRRGICDMDSQNISKLFPTILKNIIELCDDDFKDIVDVLNQEMVGNNINTSGSYMPNDQQMRDYLFNASVYKRPALRIILDRLELIDNTAPVDLSDLSIEHLMPQTFTKKWLEDLKTDEETYLYNLHRLGNLTLATKPDNSLMQNHSWEYKKQIIEKTLHIKMNNDIKDIEQWNLQCIEDRTGEMIGNICKAYPYPQIKASFVSDDSYVEDAVARKQVFELLFKDDKEIVKNKIYTKDSGKTGYVIGSSKVYNTNNKEVYWFEYSNNKFEKLEECDEKYYVLLCRGKKTTIVNIPMWLLEDKKNNFNKTLDEEGNIKHYHIKIHRGNDGKLLLLLPKPIQSKMDISKYILAEI